MVRDSYLLASDQHNASFQQQAMQAEQQAYAQTPQLAIRAFLQMQENNRQNHIAAAHVATEQAKMREYTQRAMAYGVELDIRQKRAQTELMESQAIAALRNAQASTEQFRGTGFELGQAIQVGEGDEEKWVTWEPSGSGKPRSRPSTKEEIAHRRSMMQMEERRYTSNQRTARAEDSPYLDPDVAGRIGDRGWRETRLDPASRGLYDEWTKDFGSEALNRFLSDLIKKHRPADQDKADFIARYLALVAGEKTRERRDALAKELADYKFRSGIGATR